MMTFKNEMAIGKYDYLYLDMRQDEFKGKKRKGQNSDPFKKFIDLDRNYRL